MSAGDQFTEAHLADGTTLRLRGQLSPEQVQQKVAAFRSSKASTVQQAQADPNNTGIVSPAAPDDQSGIAGEISRGRKLLGDYQASEKKWNDPLVSSKSILNALARAGGSAAGTGDPGDVYSRLKDFSASAPPGKKAAWIEGIQRGGAHALTDTADVASSFTTPTGLALTAAGPVGKAIPALSPALKALQMLAGVHYGIEGGKQVVHAAGDTEANPADRMQEALMGAGTAAGGAAGAAEPMPAILKTGQIMLRLQLAESAHRMLSDSANKTAQMFGPGGSIRQKVSNHFQQLADDVAAADYAKTAADGKKIDISDIWNSVLKHADDYAAGKTTPNFNAIADSIQKRPVELTFKELHDLSKEVGSKFQKTATGTRDEAAAGQSLADIRKKLDARAEEVGRKPQWDAAKTIWSTLKDYQGEGTLKKMLDTVTAPAAPGATPEGGKQFFDVLRDPANQPKLKEINKALEPYGASANYFTDLAKSHAPLHNMVAGSASGGGMFGRTKAAMRAMKENPAVGIPAVAAGTAAGGALGGPIGGTIGAITALKGVERLSAANAMRKLGGPPEAVNPMESAAQVKPIGQPPGTPAATQKPMSPKPAPVPTVNLSVLKSAAKDLGHNSKIASSLAEQAAQKFPNDESAAIDWLAGKRSQTESAAPESIDKTIPAEANAKLKQTAESDLDIATRRGPGEAPPNTVKKFLDIFLDPYAQKAEVIQKQKLKANPAIRSKIQQAEDAADAKAKQIETAVTSKKIAADDTGDFQQAKRELPQGTISDQPKRAQEIKDTRKAMQGPAEQLPTGWTIQEYTRFNKPHFSVFDNNRRSITSNHLSRAEAAAEANRIHRGK